MFCEENALARSTPMFFAEFLGEILPEHHPQPLVTVHSDSFQALGKLKAIMKGSHSALTTAGDKVGSLFAVFAALSLLPSTLTSENSGHSSVAAKAGNVQQVRGLPQRRECQCFLSFFLAEASRCRRWPCVSLNLKMSFLFFPSFHFFTPTQGGKKSSIFPGCICKAVQRTRMKISWISWSHFIPWVSKSPTLVSHVTPLEFTVKPYLIYFHLASICLT